MLRDSTLAELDEQRRALHSTPTPLPTGFSNVEQFDYKLLPTAFEPWIRDIAERMQCPPDYPAISAMVALASIVGRQMTIRPKREDDWQVTPNLFGGVVGPPGVLKSPALKEPQAPIRALQAKALKEFEHDKQTFAAEELVYQEKIKLERTNIKEKLKNCQPHNAQNDASDLIGEEPVRPVCKRYVVNDTTIERLQEILSENPNGILQFRDELTGFLKQMQKPGHETDRAFILEAWNGDSSFTSDRIGRGMTHVEVACLSIVGGIQPGPLQSYFSGVAHGGGCDDGLLQRFQMLVYPDVPTVWLNVDRAPDTEARRRGHAVFDELRDLKEPKGPQVIDWKQDTEDGLPFLRFTDHAQDVFDTWRADLEFRLRKGDLPSAIESHLSKYRSLIPSLALLLHLANRESGQVGLECLRAALAWSVYLESHARRIYAPMLDPEMESARALLRKLKEGKLAPEFTIKQVYASHWSNLTNSAQAKAAINLLADYGWLIYNIVETGGAPKTVYKLIADPEEI